MHIIGWLAENLRQKMCTHTCTRTHMHTHTHTPDSVQMESSWPLVQMMHAWTSTAPVTPARTACRDVDIAGAYPVPSPAWTGHMTHTTYRQEINSQYPSITMNVILAAGSIIIFMYKN